MVVVTFLCFVNNLNVEVVNLIAILFTSIESSFHNTYARNLMTIRASAGIVTLYSIGVLAIFSGCLGVFVGMFVDLIRHIKNKITFQLFTFHNRAIAADINRTYIFQTEL